MKTYIAPEIELIRFATEEELMVSATDLFIKPDANGDKGSLKVNDGFVDLW